MKIVIVGAGRVGRKLAKQLYSLYDVIIIEKNTEIVESLNYDLDVLAIEGDGTSPEILEEAGVRDADYVIATTSNDQTNIIICGAAKTMGSAFTVARIKSREYLEIWEKGRKAFGVDLMVCSAPLVAKDVADVVPFPALNTIKNIYGPLYVANATTRPKMGKVWNVEINGRRILIGTIEDIKRAFMSRPPKQIAIIGAGDTCTIIAEMLENNGFRPKLIEMDRKRAEEAAKKLKITTVINRNAFDFELWKDEELENVDVLIVSLETDEKTMFVSLIAKHMGIDRIFAIINGEDYASIFEENDITAVSPENVTVERIFVETQKENILGTVSVIPMMEIIALKVDDNNMLDGKKSLGLSHHLGPVIREGEILIPDKKFKIRKGDIITLVLYKEQSEVARI